LNKSLKKDEEVTVNEQEPVAVTDQSTARIPMEIEPTDDSTREQVETQRTIDRLLSGAREDIGALRLTTPVGNNAVDKYRKVLNMDPDNAEALNGLDRVADEYLRLMNNALNNNDLVHAEDYLHKAVSINPDHPGIKPAKDRVDAARAVNKQKLYEEEITKQDTIIEQTKMDAQENPVPEKERRIMQDLGERIKSNPGDKQARRQLKRIADKYQKTIREAIKERDYDVAEAYVREIIKITPSQSKAYKELDKLLQNINKMKTEAGD
jgi:tetratricopeptide (TPR) repeat protein